jgi:hypothetical protein
MQDKNQSLPLFLLRSKPISDSTQSLPHKNNISFSQFSLNDNDTKTIDHFVTAVQSNHYSIIWKQDALHQQDLSLTEFCIPLESLATFDTPHH